MRPFLLLTVCLLLTSAAFSVAGTDTMKVINWNIEWFGKGSFSKVSTQTQKVKILMQAMDADVYALTEIVSVDSLESVTNALGPDFSWYVSSYGSFAASPASPDYAGAQKLAFIYRRSRVKVNSRRPFLKSSASAYYSFASGRFPFLVQTEIRGADSSWHPLSFIIIHAKAMSDETSCNRRTNGAHELKDSLDLYFPDENFLLLGDFNDDLDESICSGAGHSNYEVFVTDTARYAALTLPLSLAGVSSIAGFSSFLDHVIASNELAQYYVPGSATSLKNFVTALVPDYVSQVSDHYPTLTKYILKDEAGTVVTASQQSFALRLFPNPAQGQLTVQTPVSCFFQIMAPDGRRMQNGELPAGGNTLDLKSMQAGIYYLIAWNEQGRVARQFVLL